MESEEKQPVEEESAMEEEDDYNDSEEDETDLQKAKQALTGRGVMLSDLMDEGIIHAGENLLSIDYRGQRFEADLLANGKIKWHGAEEEFCTPSAWATHCKRLVNPIKRSGCGWASVKYKGRKLDTWKSVWSRRHHPGSPYRSTSPHQGALVVGGGDMHNGSFQTPPSAASSSQENGLLKGDLTTTAEAAETKVQAASAFPVAASTTTATETKAAKVRLSPPSSTAVVPPLVPVANGAEKSSSRSTSEAASKYIREEGLNLSMAGPNAGSIIIEDKSQPLPNSTLPCGLQPVHHDSVQYSSLGPRTKPRDPGTFVKCEHFESMARPQPFNVTVSTNALILMDFHCHLTTSEVVGYLGGSWCPETHNIRINQAFPCRCLLSDKDKAAIVEEEIRQSMERQGCSVVGWYHSHPLSQPDPSLMDINCQMHHQVSMKGPGGIYLPCVGVILSPYNSLSKSPESTYEVFWVMPPPEDNPNGYGMPMHVSCIVHKSSSLSEELLHEMNQLADFYRGSPTRIHWREQWSNNLSQWEKIKRSLRSKLPKDQTESSSFFTFLQHLLMKK